MSEKRFRKGTIDFLDGNGEQWCIYDTQQKMKTTAGDVDRCIVDHTVENCIDDLVDLLNSLYEKNQQLKIENEFLKMENEEHKDLIEKQMQKKLVVTITPTLYGWKSKVEDLEDD